MLPLRLQLILALILTPFPTAAVAQPGSTYRAKLAAQHRAPGYACSGSRSVVGPIVAVAMQNGHGQLRVSGLVGAAAVMHRPEALELRLPGRLVCPAKLPKTVPGIDGFQQSGGSVVVRLTRGAAVRTIELRNELEVDVFPGSGAPPTSSAPVERASPKTPRDLVPDLPLPFVASIDLEPGEADGNKSTLAPRPPSSSTPSGGVVPASAIAAAPAGLGAGVGPDERHAMVLPFSADAGIAILRRGGEAEVYFDERLPLDLSRFQDDPTFGKAEVSELAGGTLIRLPLPVDMSVTANHGPDGWEILVGSRHVSGSIGVMVEKRSVEFSMASPGRVMVAADPADGHTLLIGTSKSAGEAIPVSRKSIAFEALESLAGLIVRPSADDVMLQRTDSGFELLRGVGRSIDVASNSGSKTENSGLSRCFRLPATGSADLSERLRGEMIRSALAPASARFSPRLDIAETLIGLGLGREARTVLEVAATDDPAFVDDPRAHGLKALAALLSGDVADPRDWAIAGRRPSDELDLWRALATDPTAPRTSLDQALAVVAADGALIERYPDGVAQLARRRHAQLLLARGLPTDLGELAKSATTPETAVAKASAIGRLGDPKTAAALLEVQQRSGDLGIAASALLARTVVDVQMGRSSPLAAASIIAAHELDWRATGMSDAATGIKAIDLERAGRYRDAIRLRNKLGERSAALRDVGDEAIAADLDRLGDATIVPAPTASDLAGVLAEEAAVLDHRPVLRKKIQIELVDQLDRLGLPAKAADSLGRIIEETDAGPDRNSMQDRLVELRLRADDVAAARRAFDLPRTQETDAGASSRRALLSARLLAREQRPDEALKAMAGVSNPGADELRAGLLATCGRWHEAKALLAELVGSLPPDGMLDGQQADLVIRLATASARDGDKATLIALTTQYDRRLPDDRARTSLHLITAAL